MAGGGLGCGVGIRDRCTRCDRGRARLGVADDGLGAVGVLRRSRVRVLELLAVADAGAARTSRQAPSIETTQSLAVTSGDVAHSRAPRRARAAPSGPGRVAGTDRGRARVGGPWSVVSGRVVRRLVVRWRRATVGSLGRVELRLDGKVALVTGASKGIGKAIASAFADAGAQVMISSRKRDALEAAAAEMTGDVAVFEANAGNLPAAKLCVEATVQRFGGIDILVNNAATNPYMGPTLDIDEARYDKTVEVNLKAPLFWSQFAWHASMRHRPGGSIINVASIGGLSVEPTLGNYNVTKAGLIHLTRTIAKELAPTVRVNALAPGLVKTDMARALWENNEEAMAQHVTMKRLGEPEDIANAALFLASDAGSWICGHTLVVDGGMLL